jgi:hypothetical protein
LSISLAEGMGNREIAQQLNLSEHTVKNYLFRIFEKLGFSNRVELVLYAIARLNQPKTPPVNEPWGCRILVTLSTK